MRFGNYGLYFRYIPGQKKLRKQFLNKSKERRVPDDTLRFLLCVGHDTDLVGSNPTAGIYRQAKRTTSRCQ